MRERITIGSTYRFNAAALVLGIVLAIMLAGACVPALAWANDAHAMNRLYNPNSGEHFYTADDGESDDLVALGWRYEGTGWYAPSSGDDVYRLYNPNAGDHHYTMSAAERDYLVSVGWSFEGVGWYSDSKQQVPLYRQYNPNAVAGAHSYTSSRDENDFLVSVGWSGEGVGWYGVSVSEGDNAPSANDGQLDQDADSSVSQDAGSESASTDEIVTTPDHESVETVVKPDATNPAPTPDTTPVSSPDPDPDPTSNSDPAPAADPDSDSDPAPVPDPAPTADPGPDSTPTPNPDPDPATVPDPDPVPTADSNPDPDPAPAADPSPDPDPAPAADPSPDPNPAPAADPSPTPDPSPSPVQPTHYQIMFHANNGVGVMASQTADTGSSVTLPVCTFTRDNYVFAGWNTAANGDGTAYADCASVRDLASAGSSTTLYAQWEVSKSGWYTEDGKDVYYVDGLMCMSQDDVYASAGNGHPAGYRSFKSDGTVNMGWKDDKYYNPSNDGVRVSGHFKVPHSGGANWYYFDGTTGVRVTNTWRDNRYFGTDGVRYSGMRAVSNGSLFGDTYYFDPKNDDIRATNTWYQNRFFGADGVRYSGMKAVTYGGGTNVYYFDPANDCIRATNTWYGDRFFGSDGVRYSGHRGVTLNGGTNYYYFDPNNDCVRATNIWWENRFFGADGVRYSGVRDVTYGGGTNTYYFDPNDDGVRQLDVMEGGYWFHYKTGVGLYFGEYESWQFAQLVLDVYNDYRVNQAATGGHYAVRSNSAYQGEAVLSAKIAAETWSQGGHNVKYRLTNWSDILQTSSWRKTPWEIVSRWIGSDGHRKMMQCDSADVCSFGVYYDGKAWYYSLIYHWAGSSNQSGE